MKHIQIMKTWKQAQLQGPKHPPGMYKNNILRVKFMEIRDLVFRLGENLLAVQIVQILLCYLRVSLKISTKKVRTSSQ